MEEKGVVEDGVVRGENKSNQINASGGEEQNNHCLIFIQCCIAFNTHLYTYHRCVKVFNV